MYRYQAYGLVIDSAIALPELMASDVTESRRDVVIAPQSLPFSPLASNPNPHAYQLTPEGLYLSWQTVGTFLIEGTHSILFDPDQQADEGRLRLFLLGAALGVILHRRGFFVLHASAAIIDGKAVVFMGNKGWGKSTLVATLHHRGHTVLGDDVVAIDLSNPALPMVLPAFPKLNYSRMPWMPYAIAPNWLRS